MMYTIIIYHIITEFNIYHKIFISDFVRLPNNIILDSYSTSMPVRLKSLITINTYYNVFLLDTK